MKKLLFKLGIGIGTPLEGRPSPTTTRTGHVSGDSADPKQVNSME
ncbi:MAG: hypothetical protein OER04_10940 [Cyclobacteriaceae bacterium]|nr:hypothetical protein [Cyclobacteriaceae bacterium]